MSWDFEEADVLSTGWGNATVVQMEMRVSISSGSLRCAILGYTPKIESPNVYIETTPRHYITFRASYGGAADSARLLIRTGNSPSPDQQSLMNREYWTSRLPMKIIDGTGFLDSVQPKFSLLVDSDPYTYFSTSYTAGFIVFDLQDYRWITSISVLPFGDSSSPKDCVLQYSITSGVGPFQTVSSFTLMENNAVSGSMQPQVIQGFNGYARYWRLLTLNNYGAQVTRVREVDLIGHDDTVNVVPIDLDRSGEFKIYYLPIHDYLSGIILRMRLELHYGNRLSASNPVKGSVSFQDALSIDYIRIVRAPEVWRVRGCLDKYYDNTNYQAPTYNVTTVVDYINGHLPIYSFIKNALSQQYATTYDCPTTGGVQLTIDGINFGPQVNVWVGGQPCPVSSVEYSATSGRQQTVVCTLPARNTAAMVENPVRVRVQNAIVPGLFHEVPGVEYRIAPAAPFPPTVTNIGAHRVDLTWSPPSITEFDQMTITGYKILWFRPQFRSRVSNLT
eukprot:gene24544-31964_t